MAPAKRPYSARVMAADPTHPGNGGAASKSTGEAASCLPASANPRSASMGTSSAPAKRNDAKRGNQTLVLTQNHSPRQPWLQATIRTAACRTPLSGALIHMERTRSGKWIAWPVMPGSMRATTTCGTSRKGMSRPRASCAPSRRLMRSVWRRYSALSARQKCASSAPESSAVPGGVRQGAISQGAAASMTPVEMRPSPILLKCISRNSPRTRPDHNLRLRALTAPRNFERTA